MSFHIISRIAFVTEINPHIFSLFDVAENVMSGTVFCQLVFSIVFITTVNFHVEAVSGIVATSYDLFLSELFFSI